MNERGTDPGASHGGRERDRETERDREKGRYEKQERENLLHIGTQWHADQRVCREVRGGKGVCECVCVFVMGKIREGGKEFLSVQSKLLTQ